MKRSIKYFVFTLLFYSNCVGAFAAGVLPYAWHDNQMWLLFGQEASWIRSLKWQDFGGSAERGQTIHEAAAREFSEETRAIWGDSFNKLNDAGFNVEDLNSKVKEQRPDSIENYVKPHKKNIIKCLISTAITDSVTYILPKLSDDFKVYRKAYSYHMFAAEVDFIDIATIRGAPKIHAYDKVDYAWVPLQELKQILLEAKEHHPNNPDQHVKIPEKYTDPNRPKLEFHVFQPLANTLLDQRGQKILNQMSRIEQERILQGQNLAQQLSELSVSLAALEQQLQLN